MRRIEGERRKQQAAFSLWRITMATGTLKVLVADDHEVVRKGLRTILEEQPGWEVSGEASDGREAVDKVRALKPDVTVALAVYHVTLAATRPADLAHVVLHHRSRLRWRAAAGNLGRNEGQAVMFSGRCGVGRPCSPSR